MRIDVLAFVTVVVVGLCGADVALGRTWRVELSGSGDFRDIQPAVEAASPGDTIRIGPGRFDQLHEIVAPAWTEETIIPVTKDDLTFIGAGTAQTIIGKSSLYWPSDRFPMVISSVEAHDVLIRDVTIENMRSGVYWYRGTLNMENCIFQRCVTAVTAWVDGGHIRNCTFDVSGDYLALGPGLTTSLDVSDCRFIGYGQGLGTGGSARNINFTNCVFEGNRSALGYDSWSSGTLRNVSIIGTISIGLWVTYNSEVVLDGVHIDGGDYGIYTSSGSRITGSNVVIEETNVASIYASSEATISLSGSHVFAGAGLAVLCSAYVNAPVSLNLANNYWGTTDQATIDGMIFDSNDDSSVHCTANYHPFANGPVPTEQTSWGDLKASFR